MNIKFKLNEVYTAEEGYTLICYERTKKFAFLCPYKFIDNNKVELNIAETRIYSVEEGNTSIEAIETMIYSK